MTETDPKTVNVTFPVTGPKLPVDHGWVIYAAISKVVPFVHGNPTVSIRGIEGCTGMGDWLRLNSDARLELRLPEGDVPQLLALEGERLNIRTAVLTLGNAQVRPLEASTEVHARIVVVAGSTEWEDARVVIQRRLETLGVAAQVTGGKRRVLSVKRFKNVGFGVGLSGLSLDGSIQVMTRGIGGRRSMGAGYFVPGPLPYGSQSSLTGQYPSLTRLPPR